MARRLPKPCKYLGSPKTVRDGQYCPEHQAIISERQKAKTAVISRVYGYDWRERIRPAFLAEHPLCEVCLSKDKYTPATEVHHKIAIVGGGTNDFANLQALCKSYHSAITLKNNPPRQASTPKLRLC